MFEIPDDDEHLFDDIPLDDITNKKPVENQSANGRPQLRVPESHCTGNTTKQLCSGDNGMQRDFNLSPEQAVSDTNNRDVQIGEVISPGDTNVSFNGGNRHSATLGQRVATPVVTTRTVSRTKATINQARSSADSVTDHFTPKRMRKFPGPAGLLPQLQQGKGIDIQTVSIPDRTLQPSTPILGDSEEAGNSSSQSSEDVFNDAPWQALLADLGDDGVKLMKKFSIGCTLLKAGKKQLHQGKVVLLCGFIEMIESHGSEASITLRDRSGKMQGTVHRDLLKEYEVELQIGTVLVLKQVSIISLSNRNHYLNITPSNLVCLYHSRQDRLTTLRFHGSQESLRSVLSALEKKAASRRSMDASLTPRSSTGSISASLSRRSSTGTPVLQGSFPTTPDLNQRLGRPGTPYSANTSSRLTTPAGVRDVSVVNPESVPVTPTGVVNPDSVPVTPTGVGRGGSHGRLSTFGQISAPAGRLSSLLGGKTLSMPGNTPGISATTTTGQAGVAGMNTSPKALGNLNCNKGDDSNNIGRSGIIENNTGSFPQTPNTNSSWRFKTTSSTPLSGINPSTPVPAMSQTNRSCQLSVSTPSHRNTDPDQQTGCKSKWSFKSRSSTSPNSCPPPADLQTSPVQATMMSAKPSTEVMATEDLWDDDLNDEILSQLSDDMT